MHFSRASLALLAAGLASAQLPDLPSCSLNCLVSALTSDGCSSLTDYACHCQKPQLVSDVTPCVQSACNLADQSSVSSAVVSQCSAAGHPISVPPVSAASTTASETTTTTESSTQTVTQTATGTSTASSTGASSTTPSSPSPSSSHHHSSSSVSTTTTSTSTESTTTTTSSSASATTTLSNNAGSNKANVAGVAAVAAAALYVL